MTKEKMKALLHGAFKVMNATEAHCAAASHLMDEWIDQIPGDELTARQLGAIVEKLAPFKEGAIGDDLGKICLAATILAAPGRMPEARGVDCSLKNMMDLETGELRLRSTGD